MRYFSEYEKDIMRKLIKSKAGIPGLLSQDFIKNVRLLIYYLSTGEIRYEFRSNGYDFATATDELAKLVELLKYLLNENLIRIIYPATTSINNLTVPEHWSIGDSTSTMSQIKLLSQSEADVPNFFRDNRNNSFEGTQDLKSLEKHKFMNWEEVKHRQIIRVTVIGGIVTFLGSIIIPMAISYWQYKKNYDELNNRIENIDKDLETIMGDQENNSTRGSQTEINLSRLKEQVDSIKTVMKARPKPSPPKNGDKKTD